MRAVFCFGIHDVFCPTRSALKTLFPAKMPNLSTAQFSFFKHPTTRAETLLAKEYMQGVYFLRVYLCKDGPPSNWLRTRTSTGWCCRSR